MEVERDAEKPTAAAAAAGDLIAALEQATLMAKQLPTAAHPSHLHQIHTALHSAHRHLSLFLSRHPPPAPVNSDDDEPMQIGDDEDEQNSAAANMIEWRMREILFIQNKRPKRQLSPAAEQRRSYENVGAVRGGGDVAAEEFDPIGTKMRSLDLIYQFHA